MCSYVILSLFFLLPFLCFLVSLSWHSCHFSNFTVIPGIPALTVIRVMPFRLCVLVIPRNFSMAGIPELLLFLVFLYSCHSWHSCTLAIPCFAWQLSGLRSQDRGGTGATGKNRKTRFTEETRKHDAPQTFTWNWSFCKPCNVFLTTFVFDFYSHFWHFRDSAIVVKTKNDCQHQNIILEEKILS